MTLKTKRSSAPSGRFVERMTHLVLGLTACGVGVGLMLRSELGVASWDVLHQGLSRHFGLTVGMWSVIVAGIVLLTWIPLGERPGFGTFLDAVLVGTVIDLVTVTVPTFTNLAIKILSLGAGIVLTAFGSGLYLNAGFGPGSRDGLMTAVAKRGHSIRLTRTVIEASVITIGWLLGGTFGIGTIAFALLIGPLVQFFLTRLEPRSQDQVQSWPEVRGLR